MNDFSGYRRLEFSHPDEINKVQGMLFRKHLDYIINNSPYYRRVLGNLDIDKVSLENLADLPFTDKSAYEKNNDELLSVPMHKITDIVMSSGTTGKPTRVMYTENDLGRLAYNEKISFEGCGITREDIVLLTCTMDRCFIAGLAYFMGVRSLGAAAVRNGLSSFASHMDIIKRIDPTVIIGVPSFLYKLGEFLQSKGVDPVKTAVSRLICIGEPIRDRELSLLKMGRNLGKIWSSKVYSTYASSETITTFCECTAQKGGHLHPELAIVEIVGENGETLSPGDVGEIVVTTLFLEGMPLLRFKTGDMSFLINERCECGRYSPRLGPVLGRKKYMIKFRGTTLYPQALYAVLDGIPEVGEYYVAVSNNFELSDIINVYVSVKNNACSPQKIMDELQAHLRVRPEVTIVSEEEVKKQILPVNSRKINRFLDRRNH